MSATVPCSSRRDRWHATVLVRMLIATLKCSRPAIVAFRSAESRQRPTGRFVTCTAEMPEPKCQTPWFSHSRPTRQRNARAKCQKCQTPWKRRKGKMPEAICRNARRSGFLTKHLNGTGGTEMKCQTPWLSHKALEWDRILESIGHQAKALS